MYGLAPVVPWYVRYWKPIALVIGAIFLLCVCLFAMNQWTAMQNVQELIDINVERAADAQKYEALAKRNQELLDEQQGYRNELAVKDAEILAIQQKNAELEASKQVVTLSIRLLRTEDQLLEKFKATFPQVARDRGLGIIELQDGGVTLPYLVTPAWFAETFIADHEHMAISNEQLDGYREAEQKYGDSRTLSEKLLQTEKLRTTAYQDAQRECAVTVDHNRDKLEECLREPRIDIPNKWGWLGGLAIGGVTCGAVTGKIKF